VIELQISSLLQIALKLLELSAQERQTIKFIYGPLSQPHEGSAMLSAERTTRLPAGKTENARNTAGVLWRREPIFRKV
jgi:hypothetical protein